MRSLNHYIFQVPGSLTKLVHAQVELGQGVIVFHRTGEEDGSRSSYRVPRQIQVDDTTVASHSSGESGPRRRCGSGVVYADVIAGPPLPHVPQPVVTEVELRDAEVCGNALAEAMGEQLVVTN